MVVCALERVKRQRTECNINAIPPIARAAAGYEVNALNKVYLVAFEYVYQRDELSSTQSDRDGAVE